MLSGIVESVRSDELLWVFLVRRLLLSLPVTSIALGSDRFFDSVPGFLASAAESFTQFFACRDGFTLCNFVASLFASLPDFLSRTLKTATY